MGQPHIPSPAGCAIADATWDAFALTAAWALCWPGDAELHFIQSDPACTAVCASSHSQALRGTACASWLKLGVNLVGPVSQPAKLALCGGFF